METNKIKVGLTIVYKNGRLNPTTKSCDVIAITVNEQELPRGMTYIIHDGDPNQVSLEFSNNTWCNDYQVVEVLGVDHAST